MHIKDNRHSHRAWLWLLAAVVLAFALFVGTVATGNLCITSDVRPDNRYAHTLLTNQTSFDQDGDGINNQADILEGALAYVSIHPRYRSAYYAGGYPNDGYGVCTDVVAFALHSAGFDLRSLVAEDVTAAPVSYDIDTPDPNIDFRRVKNLQVYFERNAQVLTCDTAELGAWQGGDIVVYENHIGIVSDRRNEHGVPYLIHHASPFQLAYEEDVLKSYGEIVGHYRMG